MPSASASSTPKTPLTKALKTTSSSWPRPSKALKAEVTIQPPSFSGAKEKHSPIPVTEQKTSKHQFLSLAPLTTIAEQSKQEPVEKDSNEDPAVATQSSSKADASARQHSDRIDKPMTSDLMETDKVENHQADGSFKASETPRFSSSNNAASIPLPQSPVDDGSLEPAGMSPSTAPTQEMESAQHVHFPSDDLKTDLDIKASDQTSNSKGDEGETWASMFSSILPQAMFDQPSRQNTSTAHTQASRASSITPGAYPESDPTEETPIPTPGSIVGNSQSETGQSGTNPPQTNGKSMRPRKSVSIALPNGKNDPEDVEVSKAGTSKTDDIASTENDSVNLAKTGMDAMESAREEAVDEQLQEADRDAKHEGDAVPESEHASQVNQNLVNAPLQVNQDRLLRPSSSSENRDRSASRASSIAASTLHERESLAPSDADNSSLKPLIPSPKDARSSHFFESLKDESPELMSNKHREAASSNGGADSPPIVDDLSTLSTINSSAASDASEPGGKQLPEYPFPSVDNGEGPSGTAPSQLAPKIVIKDASEAESSMHTPPLRAPTTTPVQDGSSPRRRATFVALGEPSDHPGPVKLPMKRRKLYVRKARYHVLRQPILNAALGRQVGAQAKSALKKLANGELIIIEPPASL
ncbi:MAG: hypothetical protein Q9170_006340 [Blastenia crenularia]